MPQQLNITNINEHRDYPFKEKKLIPVVDFFMKVHSTAEKVYISSVNEKEILYGVNDNNEYGVTPVGHYSALLGRPSYIFRRIDEDTFLDEPIGFIIFSKVPNFPISFTSEETTLLESTWEKESTDGLNRVYVKKEDGRYIRLKPNVVLEAGNNITIDTKEDSNTIEISALNVGSSVNYLKAIQVGNDLIKGESISIYGTNIIRIAGVEFDTIITDPSLGCPRPFPPTLKGDPGDQGAIGVTGSSGEALTRECCAEVDQANCDCADDCVKDEGEDDFCAEFDSLCELPNLDLEFPPLPPPPDFGQFSISCPLDIGFDGVNIPGGGGGGGSPCPINIEEIENYSESITGVDFFEGMFTSYTVRSPASSTLKQTESVAGPLTEFWAGIEGRQGTPGLSTPVNNTLFVSDSYIVRLSNIEVEFTDDFSTDIVTVYAIHGFKDPGPNTDFVGTRVLWNAPHTNSDDLFKYYVDDNCDKCTFYGTLPESFTGDWSTTVAKTQRDRRRLYIVWQKDGRRALIKNVRDFVENTTGNIPKVVVFDTQSETKTSELDLSIFIEDKAEVFRQLNSGDIGLNEWTNQERVTTSLEELGLMAMSSLKTGQGNDISSSYFWRTAFNREVTFITTDNFRKSFYREVDLAGSKAKVYEFPDESNEVADAGYFDSLILFREVNTVDSAPFFGPITDGPILIAGFCDYVGPITFTIDAFTNYLFTKEELGVTDNAAPIVVDRVHFLTLRRKAYVDDDLPSAGGVPPSDVFLLLLSFFSVEFVEGIPYRKQIVFGRDFNGAEVETGDALHFWEEIDKEMSTGNEIGIAKSLKEDLTSTSRFLSPLEFTIADITPFWDPSIGGLAYQDGFRYYIELQQKIESTTISHAPIVPFGQNKIFPKKDCEPAVTGKILFGGVVEYISQGYRAWDSNPPPFPSTENFIVLRANNTSSQSNKSFSWVTEFVSISDSERRWETTSLTGSLRDPEGFAEIVYFGKNNDFSDIPWLLDSRLTTPHSTAGYSVPYYDTNDLDDYQYILVFLKTLPNPTLSGGSDFFRGIYYISDKSSTPDPGGVAFPVGKTFTRLAPSNAWLDDAEFNVGSIDSVDRPPDTVTIEDNKILNPPDLYFNGSIIEEPPDSDPPRHGGFNPRADSYFVTGDCKDADDNFGTFTAVVIYETESPDGDDQELVGGTIKLNLDRSNFTFVFNFGGPVFPVFCHIKRAGDIKDGISRDSNVVAPSFYISTDYQGRIFEGTHTDSAHPHWSFLSFPVY